MSFSSSEPLKYARALIALLLLGFLAACGVVTDTPVPGTPGLESAPPYPTPYRGPFQTWTPRPTWTPREGTTPLTATPTGTPTNTLTATPSRTSLPSHTPTATHTGSPTPTVTGTPPTATSTPTALSLGPCTLFPADYVYNTAINTLPLDSHSTTWIANMTAGGSVLDPNFSAALVGGFPNGVPWTTVTGVPTVHVTVIAYPAESDFGAAPIPTNAPIQGNGTTGDRHVLVWDTGACIDYELYHGHPLSNGDWTADSTAKWDLRSYTLRPDGWTSPDAAGLALLPIEAKYAEVNAGVMNHALRLITNDQHVTTSHIWPARHSDGQATGSAYPPMGARFRLKASVDISAFPAQAQVIAQTLKTYGAILADTDPGDNDFELGGEPNLSWSDSALSYLRSHVAGTDFEVVDETGIMVDPNSGQTQ